MPRFPQDRFDEPPASVDRVGAHRAPAPRGRGWVRFAWGALATGLLVVAGLFALTRFTDFSIELPIFAEPTPTPTVSAIPTAEPVIDPAQAPEGLLIDISVFNASGVEGVADQVGDVIAGAGWPDPVRANAAATQEKTIVYYATAEYEGVARGLAQLIGAADVQLTDAYPGAPLTIVVGTDFVGGTTDGETGGTDG